MKIQITKVDNGYTLFTANGFELKHYSTTTNTHPSFTKTVNKIAVSFDQLIEILAEITGEKKKPTDSGSIFTQPIPFFEQK